MSDQPIITLTQGSKIFENGTVALQDLKMTNSPTPEPTLFDVIKKIDEFSAEVKKIDERFAEYRQATQWVVQLAFTLIASATITVIITAVFRK